MMRPSLIQSGGGSGPDLSGELDALTGRFEAIVQDGDQYYSTAFGARIDENVTLRSLGLGEGDLHFALNTHETITDAWEYIEVEFGAHLLDEPVHLTLWEIEWELFQALNQNGVPIDLGLTYNLGRPYLMAFAAITPFGETYEASLYFEDTPLAVALGFDWIVLTSAYFPGPVARQNMWTASKLEEISVRAAVLASGTPVRERVIQYEEVTSSGTWAKSDVLERPEFAGLTADDIEMEVICCSGGAGGRSGSNAPGGYPGRVAWRHFRMSDLPATVSMTVGAGGASDGGGGSTLFGGPATEDALVLCYGPSSYGPGGAATLEEGAIAGLNFSQSKAPNLALYSGGPSRPNSADGPGAGGFATSGLTDPGRGAGVLGVDGAWAPATVDDRSDGKPGVPRSFGAGGRGNTSGTGGAGGHPGGGGGGGSTAGGPGGNGIIGIVYRVKEIA